MKNILLSVITGLNKLKSRWGIPTRRFGGPILGRDNLQCGGEPVCKLLDSMEIEFNPPLECDKGRKHTQVEFPEVWLYKHRDVTVVRSPGGLHAISKSGHLIPGLGLLEEDFYFKTRLITPRPRHFIDKGFILESSHSSNYYHWCVDVLPVISLMPKIPSLKAIVLKRDFHRECQLQSIDSEPFDFYFHHEPIQVAELYSVSPLASLYGTFRPEIVKNFWKKEKPINLSKKNIYLTRGENSRRRLLNEHEILSILQPFGFETVDCSKLSLECQKALFNSADIVVGVHGAGFANLVHCQKGTRVIEIFGPGFRHFFYRFLADIFDLDHYSIISNPKIFNSPEEAHCNDFSLDLAGLKILRNILELIVKNK